MDRSEIQDAFENCDTIAHSIRGGYYELSEYVKVKVGGVWEDFLLYRDINSGEKYLRKDTDFLNFELA